MECVQGQTEGTVCTELLLLHKVQKEAKAAFLFDGRMVITARGAGHMGVFVWGKIPAVCL